MVPSLDPMSAEAWAKDEPCQSALRRLVRRQQRKGPCERESPLRAVRGGAFGSLAALLSARGLQTWLLLELAVLRLPVPDS